MTTDSMDSLGDPKITVITVCFNSAATLGDTLRSVANQSWPNVEHIVIDGASKDATQEVVAHYGAHVARFISEPDRGIYDAMNKGVRVATGDVIGFLNADDVYAHPNVLATVAGIMKREHLFQVRTRTGGPAEQQVDVSNHAMRDQQFRPVHLLLR